MNKGDVVADINFTVKILRDGRLFGYEIIMEGNSVTGWTNTDGQALQSSIHAWRTAMRRFRDHSVCLPTLGTITHVM